MIQGKKQQQQRREGENVPCNNFHLHDNVIVQVPSKLDKERVNPRNELRWKKNYINR